MAVLSVTGVKEFKLSDDLVIQKLSGTIANGNASDEWVATNLKSILAVLGSVVTGTSPAAIDASAVGVRATGTITCVSVVNNDTFTINGRIYTALDSPTGFGGVDVGASDTVMAASIVVAINRDVITADAGTTPSADCAANADVWAANTAGVVTLTARVPGVGGTAATYGRASGNSITLASSSGSTLAVSGALLTGGLEPVVDPAGLNFVLNAQGTGSANSSSHGDLGVESSGGATTFDVVVLGVRR